MLNHGQEFEPRACTNPAVGERLGLYFFQRLGSVEGIRQVEAHTYECEYCAEQLSAMAPYMDIAVEEAARTPVPAPSPCAPVVQGRFRRFPAKPAWLAVAASLVLAIWLVPRYAPQDPTGWAVIEPPPVVSRAGTDAVAEAAERSRAGEDRAGVQILEQALARDPDDVRAMLYLGYLYLKQKESGKAITILNTALPRAPSPLDEEVRWLLANAYLRDGQWEKARPLLEQIVAQEAAHHGAARTLLEKWPQSPRKP